MKDRLLFVLEKTPNRQQREWSFRLVYGEIAKRHDPDFDWHDPALLAQLEELKAVGKESAADRLTESHEELARRRSDRAYAVARLLSGTPTGPGIDSADPQIRYGIGGPSRRSVARSAPDADLPRATEADRDEHNARENFAAMAKQEVRLRRQEANIARRQARQS